MQSSREMSVSLAEKVTLITGASAGLGAATSCLFARLGAKLCLTGRNQENLQKTAKQCEEHGAQVLTVIGDLTKEDDTKQLIDKTIQHFGKLDVLINNAGIFVQSHQVHETSMDQYDKVMNINLRSVFHLTSLAIPHLIQTKGCIVNVSSVAGLKAFPRVATYCMSKAAMDSFTRCTALELGPKSVRVNSVNPGVVDTGIHHRVGYDAEAVTKIIEGCKTSYPLGRAGEADEVANAIAFLASDAASFITGALLSVDGGRVISAS